jgi:hypothetical protein
VSYNKVKGQGKDNLAVRLSSKELMQERFNEEDRRIIYSLHYYVTNKETINLLKQKQCEVRK